MPKDDTLCSDRLHEVVCIKVKSRLLVNEVHHHLSHGSLLLSVKHMLVGLDITV